MLAEQQYQLELKLIASLAGKLTLFQANQERTVIIMTSSLGLDRTQLYEEINL